ncbi:glutathione synthetase-like [Gigantopelta aegis]|uniref:glutathione synthetase-like n=1 Tax=Gigantopelta aegis TaxID=1735272 RepID=UPI001B88AF9B|nr:glutathione synthetase-like [Gigantopelta aegis]
MATYLGSSGLPSKEALDELLLKCKDFAFYCGLTKRPADAPDSENTVEFMPFTLFPSVVPLAAFVKARDSMTDFNRLMHKVAHDHSFLEQSLKNVIQVDEFTKRLWNIYITVRQEGIAQPVSLGMFRNDFMLDKQDDGSQQPKQIEFNAIASSFMGPVTGVVHLHRFSLHRRGCSFQPNQILDNEPALHMAEGLVKAWHIYDNPRSVVLFIVSDVDTNVIDQRWMEFKTFLIEPRIRVIRKTFSDVHKHGRLWEDKRLVIDGDEVAVVYFRGGYSPSSFRSEKDWEARLMLERSRAIKSPSIQYHLSGTKKIQQELARAGILEQFISDTETVSRIRQMFAGQYTLDLGEEGDRATKLAFSSPHKFVLKPQREGGGNNLYGDDIATFLRKHENSKERNAYILMERVYPVPQKNYLVKAGIPSVLSDTVCELGIYGVYIGTADKEIMNTECGHMLRTKDSSTDEGGICAGFACIDSPFLV